MREKRAPVVSAFAVNPLRIGGVEMFARELSAQLACYGRKSVLCFIGKPAANVEQFLDLPNIEIEIVPGLDRADRNAVAAISRILSKNRPEILHMHFTGHISPYPWVTVFHSVRGNYLTDHASRPEGFVPARSAWWKRVIGRAANAPLSRVIAVSDYNARACVASGTINPDRVVRVYNGVDLRRDRGSAAAFRLRYGIPAGRPIVLQVSWMIPEKGIEDLLDAARIVLSATPNVQFVLAGEGSQRNEYMARAAGIADRFTWTGIIDDPLTSGLYEAADVVCQLSRWEEAFGWTNAEAMSCGRPLVASQVGGVPEIVEEGVSGYLVGRRRPDQAADRVLRLLADHELRERFGTRARAIVEEKFDLQRNVSDLIRIYKI
jgi:glycosyltransferase involved in cell wall biosynthesis